jgi:asparagine synthase (glutamine-hydrolysing)
MTGLDLRTVRFEPGGAKSLSLVDSVVGALESFEPSAVRPGLYTYLLSERIHQDGFRVALCGEGADELFAGYEPLEQAFAQSSTAGRSLQEQCLSMMHQVNLQRVDRCGMRFGLEIREPFLDIGLADYAMHLDPAALLKMVDGQARGKQPLREIYDLYPAQLPAVIRDRLKTGFDIGAGLGLDGADWLGLFEDAISGAEFDEGRRAFAAFEIATKEELFYLRLLANHMDISRVPHLKGRLRLDIPRDMVVSYEDPLKRARAAS